MPKRELSTHFSLKGAKAEPPKKTGNLFALQSKKADLQMASQLPKGQYKVPSSSATDKATLAVVVAKVPNNRPNA